VCNEGQVNVWVFLSVALCVTQFALEPVKDSKSRLYQESSQNLAEMDAKERSRSTLKPYQAGKEVSIKGHSFIEEIVLKQIVLGQMKHLSIFKCGDLGGIEAL
jgi:hypothetical protein